MSKFTGIILLFIVIAGAGLVYYLDGEDYLNGKEFHYSGTSNVTSNQASNIIDKHTVYLSGDIYSYTLQDNGIVEIEYDFYDENQYEYLTRKTFSYFDTPIIHFFISDETPLMIVISFVGMIFLFAFCLRPRQSNTALMNGLWYLSHPLCLFKKQKPPEFLHKSIGVKDIKIDCSKAGIIALRTWKYMPKDGYLYSVGVGQTCWKSKINYSDKLPNEKNESGYYSFRLGCLHHFDFVRSIVGIVSMGGEFCEHEDGVIRAESCEILHLIVNKSLSKYADKLSSYYGVPVTITENTINQYCHWVTSKNGIDCMTHNADILTEGKYVNNGTCDTERAVAHS